MVGITRKQEVLFNSTTTYTNCTWTWSILLSSISGDVLGDVVMSYDLVHVTLSMGV